MKQNTIAVVLGRKGSGKSTLVHELLEEAPRVLVLDYLGEYGGRDLCRVVRGRDAAFRALERAWGADRFRIAVRETEGQDSLDVLAAAAELEDYLLVIEEASAYCSPQGVPREIAQIVRYGRHRSIDQLFVAQRPSMLHRDITSAADVVISFQHHERADIDYLVQTVGEHMAAVRELAPYEITVGGPGVDLGKVPVAVLARLEAQRRGAGEKSA